MKKIIILSSLFICLIACFGACTKRGKIVNSTMILQIEPAEDITLGIGDFKELRAIVKDSKLQDVDEPVRWSVSQNESGEDLGSFSSKSLKNTVFTAESSGEGTITLFCQGVTVSINITVS
ncbi:MAG: hypothetical protein IKN62_01465 [Elusimicrobia bacterium]|nr:hypothetical protein [Elusimicrobiota bacterium]